MSKQNKTETDPKKQNKLMVARAEKCARMGEKDEGNKRYKLSVIE